MNRCYYDRQTRQIPRTDKTEADLAKASGWLGKNAPRVENSKLLEQGPSSEVPEG
jgi:hypothetical protein